MKYISLIITVLLGETYLHCLVDGIENTEPKCNHTDHSAALFDNNTLNEIDLFLDKLYSSIVTNLSYETDCTFGVHFPTKDDTIEFAVLLEGLEVRRNRYKQGLWGYCAKDGAEALMEDMENLINMSKKAMEKNEPFGICDRDQLLYCHPKHRKCQCLVDNKNFRNYASEWWDDDEEKDEPHVHVGRNFCGLIIGSDCPNGTDPKFQCLPLSTCRLKSNRSVICSKSTPATKHRKTSENEDENNTTTSTTSTTAVTTEKAKIRRKRSTAADDGTSRYRFIRHDIGNIHCQCYGYTGGSATGCKYIDKFNDKIIFKQIISQTFFFVMSYIFNLL